MTTVPFRPAGVIFDLDDTLLDNDYAEGRVGNHERLRLQAVHEVGERYGIDVLKNATIEQSVSGFMTAKVTTFTYALWNMLCIVGLRHNPDEPDTSDELMVEITRRKDQLYRGLLETNVKEVPGSTSFVNKMSVLTNGNIAIGSSAKRSDIVTYLQTKDLRKLLPDARIISVEDVVKAKPDPEVFIKAFSSFQLHDDIKSRVCVFEDDPRGIMAAKAAGLYACAITTRHSREEFINAMIPADYVATSYAEFEQIFDI